MKKPKSLKECETADQAQKYILARDGLSDEDLAGLEFVEVGPEDDLGEIIPVPLDSQTVARVRKIAKKAGTTPSNIIRMWAAELSSREAARSRRPQPGHEPKKRATG